MSAKACDFIWLNLLKPEMNRINGILSKTWIVKNPLCFVLNLQPYKPKFWSKMEQNSHPVHFGRKRACAKCFVGYSLGSNTGNHQFFMTFLSFCVWSDMRPWTHDRAFESRIYIFVLMCDVFMHFSDVATGEQNCAKYIRKMYKT